MSKAYIIDIDGTITDQSVAKFVGERAISEKNGYEWLSACIKCTHIMALTPFCGEEWAIKSFARALSKAKIKKEDIDKYFSDGMKEHAIPGAIDFLKEVGNNNDLYLVTTGLDIAPKRIAEEYGISVKGYKANELFYKDGIVSHCEVSLTDENIGKVVEDIVNEYGRKNAIIIDDRPQRYDVARLPVYHSINTFIKKKI